MTSNSFAGSASALVQTGAVHGGLHLHAPDRPHPPTPRQLPPLASVWEDRTTELAHLTSDRGDNSAVWVITGPGGVGKTTLAARALEAQDLPGGLLFADLGDATRGSSSVVLRGWLTSLGFETAGHDLVALWRTVTSQHTPLGVLVDDADDERLLRRLLPSGARHMTVATSRRSLPGLLAEGARTLPLPPLPPPASVRLLQQLLTRTADENSWADTDLSRLADECAHLPLRLCLRAAHLHLDRHPRTCKEDDLMRIEDLLTDLTDAETAVLRALAVLPVDHPEIPALAAAAELPLSEATAALERLHNLRLAEPGPASPEPTMRLHDEVCAHVEEALDQPGEAAQFLRRWIDWLLATATGAERLLAPWHRRLDRTYAFLLSPVDFDGDHDEAWRWLQRHETSLTAAVDTAEDHGWDTSVYQSVHAFWPFFHRLKPLEMSVLLHQRGLAAAQRCGDRLAQREMLTSAGVALRGLGQYDAARDGAMEALESAAADQDERGRAQALHQLGNIFLELDQPALAQVLLEAALAAREALRESESDTAELYARQAALTRLLLGRIEHDAGRHTAAIDHARSAHADLHRVGDRLDAARALALLAEATGALPSGYDPARRLLDRAEEEFIALGALPWQARICELRGHLAARHDHYEDARAAYTHAIQRRSAAPDSITPAQAAKLTRLLDQLPPGN